MAKPKKNNNLTLVRFRSDDLPLLRAVQAFIQLKNPESNLNREDALAAALKFYKEFHIDKNGGK